MDIFLFPEGIFKKEPDQKMKFRRTNQVGKFEVKKVKIWEQSAKMSFGSRSLHAPLKRQGGHLHFTSRSMTRLAGSAAFMA